MFNIIVMMDNFLHKLGIHTEIIAYLIYVIFVQIQQLSIYVRQFLLKGYFLKFINVRICIYDYLLLRI